MLALLIDAPIQSSGCLPNFDLTSIEKTPGKNSNLKLQSPHLLS